MCVIYGSVFYESINHLGNVQVVVSDKRISVCDEYLAVEHFEVEVLSAVDYYPFGMMMPDRQWYSNDDSSAYSFGFGGQMKDDEVSGVGNSYTAEYWQYDARLGRRFNIDPKPNPSISVYACFSNNPLWYIDPYGDTIRFPNIHTVFGTRFQEDLNSLYSTKFGKALIRSVHASEVDVYIRDASSWYKSDKDDVLSSITKGDYPNYWKADNGIITLSYAQRDPIQHSGVTSTSVLVLAHELVHVRDIASGFLEKVRKQATEGEITLPKLDFNNEIAEVRALIYTNEIRKELNQPIQTIYTYEGKEYNLLDEKGEPIKDYGFDIKEGLFE